MKPSIFVKPGMSPREIVKKAQELEGVAFTSTGMRDAGQSDYKNRLRVHDFSTVAPIYNNLGLFSAECHGGARWHVGVMNRKESPFEETAIYRKLMPNVMLQTLIRETNLWGYRPYAKNIIEYVVSHVDIDVWRCFSFLNDIRNMKTVAETVMKRGRLFEPAISFTQADWTTNEYYLGVVNEIVDLCDGVDEIILCIKDMAGVGSPKRIHDLVDCIKQKYPDLVIQYHRHATDGLVIPALLSAAQAGAKILDVQEDSLTRFYGQAPMLAVQAYLEESGIKVNLNRKLAEESVQTVREWIGQYETAESPFRGFDHMVTSHRMPGGAFPSSFEQAQGRGFLHLMPAILKVMSLYNKIVKYFDVTPGSQITWVTCSGFVNKYDKEHGEAGVEHITSLLSKFVEEKSQVFENMEIEDQQELLQLFDNAPTDFKNLLMGKYGALPQGWPDDWVYQSTFGEEWKQQIQDRTNDSPLELLKSEDLEKLKADLSDSIQRSPTEEEFILYLMHPKDALDMIAFRNKYGETPLLLPTNVWREGLKKVGDQVAFEHWGKPYCVELVSIGDEHEGLIHVVMRVNNKTRVFVVETPDAKIEDILIAKTKNEIGAPIAGTVWRIGNPERGVVKPGDIVHQGEEIANLEAMKMENAIIAPFDGLIVEVCVDLNSTVQQGQLLFVLEAT